MVPGRVVSAVTTAGEPDPGPPPRYRRGRRVAAKLRRLAIRAAALLACATAGPLAAPEPASAAAGAAQSGRTTETATGTARTAPAAAGPVEPYETAPDARPVTGGTGDDEGPLLLPGTYTDTVAVGERKTYRVRLDGTSNAYLSAVLAPPPGTRVAESDGIRIGLVSSGGTECSDSTNITFDTPVARPVADYATRRIGPGRECQKAGEYRYTVESVGDARDWPVEIRFMLEPGLRAGAEFPADTGDSYPTSAPGMPSGAPRDVEGGTGFNDAPATGQGAWRDELRPGESRFYRVPVDWGQQLFLDAALSGRGPGDDLRMTVFNTARGYVESADAAGRDGTVALGTVPAAFRNRTASSNEIGAMRFSGWYFVRVTRESAGDGGQDAGDGAAPLTLKVAVTGQPVGAPPYAADPLAAGFGITDADREAAREGLTGGESDRRATMRMIALTGFGTGTALLLGLVGWTVLLRRRLARTPPPPWDPAAS
ncbi:hypothetical protein ABZ714_26205 [Streptomyces sp. NPDC006798]|uniref:hypothetical protein n=1 Tax=Streptomyces sp. NPDC006798 TaxID=3155462 RepID=UPI0033D440E0